MLQRVSRLYRDSFKPKIRSRAGLGYEREEIEWVQSTTPTQVCPFQLGSATARQRTRIESYIS